jgi:hypothetical protein
VTNFIGKQPSSRVIKGQELDYTGSGTLTTTNLSAQTYQVRINSDVRGYVVFGSTSPTTTSRDTSFAEIFPNLIGEYFTVTPGQLISFSSTSTSSGSVLISEMS